MKQPYSSLLFLLALSLLISTVSLAQPNEKITTTTKTIHGVKTITKQVQFSSPISGIKPLTKASNKVAPPLAAFSQAAASAMASCPANISVNNDLGQCRAKVNYTTPAVPPDCLERNLIETTDSITATFISACSDENNYPGGTSGFYLTVYNLPALGYTNGYTVSSVDFAIYSISAVSGGTTPVTVNIYQCDPAKPFNHANFTLVSSATTNYPDQAGGFYPNPTSILLHQPINAEIPAGYAMIIEIASGQSLTMALYPSSQMGQSYRFFPCADPIELRPINLRINANGCATNLVRQTGGLPSGGLFSVGTTTNSFQALDGSTCSFDVTVTDNEKPTFTCPGSQLFCYSSTGTYSIPRLTATDNCGGTPTVTYSITGKTARNGSGSDASGSFNPGASTITWMVTDAHGNVNTCETKVTIDPQLDVSIPGVKVLSSGVAPNTVYRGYTPASSITLTAQASGGSGSYTYLWSTGAKTPSIKVSPTAGASYNVTVSDGGCSGTASKTVTVMNVSCSGKKVQVCHGGGTLCIDAGFVANHLGHGDKLGKCGAVATSVTTTKVERLQAAERGSAGVYPNPATGAFNLQLKNRKAEAAQIFILDGKGSAVESRQVALLPGAQTISFNLSGKAAGVYLLQLRSESGVQTFKVYLQR